MGNILNKTLMNFTKSMWKTETEQKNTQIRATYYEFLWKKITKKNTGMNYLDIGAGDLVNSVTFGKHFLNTYAMDASFSTKPVLKAKAINPNINISTGDAHHLPYEDNVFDVVSMISVIEHVKNPDQALREALRVLKPEGELIVQIPNKFFPVEPHTGLLFIYYIPKTIRRWLLRNLGYSYYLAYVPGFPTLNEVSRYLKNIANLKAIKEVIIPVEIVPNSIKPFYKLTVNLRLVQILPQSWLAVYSKK